MSLKMLKLLILVFDDPLRKVSQTTACFLCTLSRKQHLKTPKNMGSCTTQSVTQSQEESGDNRNEKIFIKDSAGIAWPPSERDRRRLSINFQ